MRSTLARIESYMGKYTQHKALQC